jgi:hypothetical protein
VYPISNKRHPQQQMATVLTENLGAAQLVASVERGAPVVNLFDYSDHFASTSERVLLDVTAADLGQVVLDRTISLPHVPENDWKNRGYSWATLVPAFASADGKVALRFLGQISDDSDMELVIREGAETKVTRTFSKGTRMKELFTFDVRDNGNLYVLVRFTGDTGTLRSEKIQATAYTPELLEKARLVLSPAGE